MKPPDPLPSPLEERNPELAEGLVHFIEQNQERARNNQPLLVCDFTQGRIAVDPRHRYAIGRNDSCPCLSGKKYKKCCINFQLLPCSV